MGEEVPAAGGVAVVVQPGAEDEVGGCSKEEAVWVEDGIISGWKEGSLIMGGGG